MANIDMIDESGKPRPNSDVEEAIQVVSNHMVRSMPPKVPIDLYMQFATIRECLKELLRYREALEKAEKRIAERGA